MKYFILLTLFTALSANSWSEEVEAGSAKVVSREQSIDALKKYTQNDPEVVAALKLCTDANESGESDTDPMDCLWEGENLSQAKKEEIYEALNFGNEEESYLPTVSNYKTQSSAATKVLETYMQKRLEEALFDEDDKKSIKALDDHTIFLNIYKSQLGKNLITEISAFCLYSDPYTGFIPVSDSKALAFYKDTNLKNLTKKSIISTESSEEGSAAFTGFNQCIQRVGNICRGEDVDPENEIPSRQKLAVPSRWTETAKLPISACELNRLMTGVKSAIAATDSIIETYDEMSESSTNKNHSLQVANVNRKDINVNNIVNIGSNELIDESGYEEKLKDVATDIEENCNTAEAMASEACKKYFTTNEENEAIKLESDFRNMAIAKKVEDEIDNANNDVEALRKIYKDQGLTDEDFDSLIAEAQKNNQDEFEYLSSKIKAQYNNERTALKDSLNDKLSQTEINAEDPTQTQSKAQELADTYKNSAESLAEVYQYANIVSSFIQVTTNGEKGRNTAALSAELENNYFTANSSDRQVASENGNAQVAAPDFEEIKEFGGDLDSSSGGISETSLNVEDINTMQWIKRTNEE